MAIAKKLENYLIKNNIDYEVVAHRTVYTAYDLALTTKKKLSEIAKTVAIKADQKHVLFVLPASHRLDTKKVKKLLNAKKLTIVKEIDLAKVFKIKSGAVIPFATFHKVPIYVDKNLLKSRVILIRGGSFKESLQVKAKSLIDQGGEALTTFSKKHFSEPKSPKKKAAKKMKKSISQKAKKKR
jgi:Ala-tRNA(Pro) deacylase